MTGGELLVACLAEQGVKRVFCVPGESYLAALDALYDADIRCIVARQEGGAAMMAEADGKLSGRPGVCFVTRGPGATNAAAGVHVAQQDSTPMILFVGQIARGHTGRDAFQEVDYRQMFGGIAKRVEQIEDAARIPEIISRAWHVAMSGRPGPVVIALPEDMLRDPVELPPARRVEVAEAAPSEAQMEWLASLLKMSARPFVIAGGSRWNPEAARALRMFAERWMLPVGCSFRRQQLFDHEHFCYAGDVGLGINPKLQQRVADSDLLLLLGCRFSENPSQGFTMLASPNPEQRIVHVHPGPEELGRIYAPNLPINATPGGFLSRALAIDAPEALPWANEPETAHADYLAWSETPPEAPGAVTLGHAITHVRSVLGPDAILTNGAGNFAGWLHRFHRFRRYNTQVAPTSGSMGYGLPAAIAAKLAYPKREVVCLAGDGDVQMTMQEIGTAMQEEAAIIVLVADNGQYGTIRMHQERDYPGRQSATRLRNPDFAALAEAYGAYGEKVESDADFADAFERARKAGCCAILHLPIDPNAISPGKILD